MLFVLRVMCSRRSVCPLILRNIRPMPWLGLLVKALFSRRELFHNGNCVYFDFLGASIALRFVDSYKHMGTNFSMAFDLSQEVVTRAAIIRNCARALKPVLSNPRFPLAKKFSFVKAHLFASGLFQCSTWGPLSTPLYSKIHAAVFRSIGWPLRTCFALPTSILCFLMWISSRSTASFPPW